MSLFNIKWSASLYIVLQILVSSAYSAKFVPCDRPVGKSLMNKTKSIGPNIDPCGTPEFTGSKDEILFPITTHWSLSAILKVTRNEL